MFTITTTYRTDASGKGKVTAKGHGKQRTVSINHALSSEQNHASAVGSLLNVLCDDRQRAMLLHPSGGQRVRTDHTEVAPGDFITHWTINV